MRPVHSIILKLFYSYLQLSAITAKATGLTSWRVPVIRFFYDASMRPLSTFVSLECMFHDQEMRVMVRIIIGLLLIPMVTVFTACWSTLLLIFRMKQVEWLVAKKRYRQVEALVASMNKFIDPDMAFSTHLQTWRWMARQKVLVKGMQSLILWLFILYPIVINLLMDGLACVRMDGGFHYRLRLDLDIECVPGSALAMWSIFGLLVYGLGVPLVTGIVLFRFRDRVQMPNVRIFFGFTYTGFDQRYYYYEVVHLMRKGLLLFCLIIPSMPFRMVVMIFLSLCFLLSHLRCRPFDNREYNILHRLELMSSVAQISALAVKAFGEVFSDEHEPDLLQEMFGWSMDAPVMYYALIVLAMMLHCSFWILCAWGLLCNCYLRHLRFKAECLPSMLSSYQRCLMRVFRGVNRMFFDGETHRIQIDVLTAAQRSFLYETLCQHLQLYVSSAGKFHPGVLAAAVQHAVNECTMDRQTRAKSLFRVLSETKDRKARWLGEFREAMENARGDPSNDGRNLEKATSDRMDVGHHATMAGRRPRGMLRMPSLGSLGTRKASGGGASEFTERTAVANLGYRSIRSRQMSCRCALPGAARISLRKILGFGR